MTPNKVARKDLTAQMVRDRLDYDPVTGILTWKVSPSRNTRAGTPAGNVNSKGYLVICIYHYTHPAHRLAWLHFHGAWPVNFVDHRDGIKLNNAISNLREATDSQNQLNSPHRGYNYEASSGTYRSRVTVNGKRISLGRFATAEAAHAAYIAAHKRHHIEFSFTSREAVASGSAPEPGLDSVVSCLERQWSAGAKNVRALRVAEAINSFPISISRA